MRITISAVRGDHEAKCVGQWVDGSLIVDRMRDMAFVFRDNFDAIADAIRAGAGVLVLGEVRITWKLSVISPTVHMNGTSASVLLEQNQAAFDAIERAIESLREAEPHGRDYYIQSDNALALAQEEHLARILKLRSVADDLAEISADIDRQVQARTRRSRGQR